MLFTTLPSSYAPIGASLHYGIAEVTSPSVDLRLCTDDDRLLGTKRIVDQTAFTVDVAPYLRAATSFQTPTRPSHSGFLSLDDRSITLVVELDDGLTTLRSEPRTFLVATTPAIAPSLLTALPHERLLAPSECDLLTLRIEAPMSVQLVEHRSDGSFRTHTYSTTASGIVGFGVAADDFPEAERLTLDLGACGSVHYTLLKHPEGAVRLAWRSHTGSLEHYTFPQVQCHRIEVRKQRGYGIEGYRTFRVEHEERLRLQSAYEVPATMQALAELLTAMQVWWVREGRYEAVEVVTESMEIARNGVVDLLSIEIRSTLKNRSLWS